jgi:hypothetical protein
MDSFHKSTIFFFLDCTLAYKFPPPKKKKKKEKKKKEEKTFLSHEKNFSVLL